MIFPTVAFVSASPVERQTCLHPISQQCLSALAQIQQIFGVALAAPPHVSVQQDIDQLKPHLDILCTSNCLKPTVANMTCQGLQAKGNFWLTGICGREGGEFCPIVLLQVKMSGILVAPNCARVGVACNSSCRQSLITLQARLGCCAGSWYNNTGSIAISALSQFTRCGVNLGKQCAPAIGAGSTTALCMSALLLLAVSALAIVI